VIFTFLTKSYSQEILQDRITGAPYKLNAFSDIEGIPFLFEDWRTGKVKLRNNKVFENILLKYDIFNNKFYYNQRDSLFEILEDVLEIRLHNNAHPGDSSFDAVFRNDVEIANKINRGDFVQVLASGKVLLVKHFNKKIEQAMGGASSYESTGTSRKFVSRTATYAVINNQVTQVKYSDDVLLQLTNDKKDQVKAFIKAKGLNVKKEPDFTIAISYYNLISE
jgi:hypothetical protein